MSPSRWFHDLADDPAQRVALVAFSVARGNRRHQLERIGSDRRRGAALVLSEVAPQNRSQLDSELARDFAGQPLVPGQGVVKLLAPDAV